MDTIYEPQPDNTYPPTRKKKEVIMPSRRVAVKKQRETHKRKPQTDNEPEDIITLIEPMTASIWGSQLDNANNTYVPTKLLDKNTDRRVIKGIDY
ncbi:230_t:CDS:2, partial [Acaulospora morrowiae]